MKRPSVTKGELSLSKFWNNHRNFLRFYALTMFIVSPVLIPIAVCIEHRQDIKDAYVNLIQAILHKK